MTWIGPIKKGEARNPGGLTKEARAARDLAQADLRDPEMRAAWKKGYLSQLQQENPIILKDWIDRVGGKPKEYLELSEDPESPASDKLTLGEFNEAWRAESDCKGATRERANP